jgi:FAD/FMN-containing dehydrogenase/Fe-S oxidoreductase
MTTPAHAKSSPIIPAARLSKGKVAGFDVNLEQLQSTLKREIAGEVRFDSASRALYAQDASNYRHVPLAVVIPRSADDVVATMAACRQFDVPIVSRGGGTALAGQTTNVAVVIDFSKYMNRILEIDVQRRIARVEPGVICDQLVHAGAPHRLTWGPAPATHDHCCFGGMLGNNSCGVHAQTAGKTVDNTEALEILLYDGTRMHVGWLTEAEFADRASAPGRIGAMYAKLKSLRDRNADLIRRSFPKLPRRVSGYNLDQLLPTENGGFNLARALVGTEGTCVTILEATVRLVYEHPARVLLLLGYPDIYQAGDHVPDILPFQPIGLEGMDQRLRDYVERRGGPDSGYLHLLPHGRGWLIVELGADTQPDAEVAAEQIMKHLSKDPNGPSMRLVVDADEQEHIWKIRESGLGATAFVPGEPLTWPGFEDSAVPPDRLGSYLRDLRRLFQQYDYRASVYGHFGMGCVHCRIPFDLMSGPGISKYRAFMEEATDLVVRYGGSLSGEHGDGQSRAEFLPKMFGEATVELFREFKSIWDPAWKMNPGRVVEPLRIDAGLRLGPEYEPWEPETHFKFPDDGGSFARATLRCVGVGKCRRPHGRGDEDVMCPSFMVLREEKHTTRGRAHLLWEMLRRGPREDGFRDEGVKEALDLCLACKGCKGDCPVDVDIATYKAEFMAHYYEGRLRPRSAYAFGLIDRWARLAAFAPNLANLVTQTPGIRALAKMAAGMPQNREIPSFAPETFREWFYDRRRAVSPKTGKSVVLWADTFNNHFLPDTARAAVGVLESFGYDVEVPRGHLCCGRPLYDFGMLARAKKYLLNVLTAMKPHVDRGTPIVVLEPSCCSVFRDELAGLFPDREDARRLMNQTMLLGEFLESEGKVDRLPRLERSALVQAHCHHSSIMRFGDEQRVLRAMGLDFTKLDSGCCGMAGSFGFEKEKYSVSIAEGERVLLPAVRRAARSTLIIADGFSCREQIAQGTKRTALHLAEVIALAFSHQEHNARELSEAAIADMRRHRQRRSRVRAAAVVLAASLAIGTAWLWSRARRRAVFSLRA